MLLVVDANVVISSLVKKGVTFEVFMLNHILKKFEFVAPEFLMVEVEKHRKELLEETKLPDDEFDEVMGFLMGEIDLIPSSQFVEFLSKGK
jgi:predicted nucleic acid-binding protein